MKLYEVIEELTGILKKKISYTDIAKAMNVTRQYANQIKDKELTCEQLNRINDFFGTNLATAKYNALNTKDDEDCISIPVRGEVSASMGYGVTVYNESQTATYSISKQLARDLGGNTCHLEMIFAQGDSMMPTIEGGDSLLVDHSKKEIYDGKIYCVRIENQLYAKRLQKIPPNTVVVVSDNA